MASRLEKSMAGCELLQLPLHHSTHMLNWDSVMSVGLLSFQAICFPMSSPFVYFHNFEYHSASFISTLKLN